MRKDEFEVHAGQKDIVLLGNKADLAERRAVFQRDALSWCQKKGRDDAPIQYFETSAKDYASVEQAFMGAARLALERKAKWEAKQALLLSQDVHNDKSDDDITITIWKVTIARALQQQKAQHAETVKKICEEAEHQKQQHAKEVSTLQDHAKPFKKEYAQLEERYLETAKAKKELLLLVAGLYEDLYYLQEENSKCIATETITTEARTNRRVRMMPPSLVQGFKL